MNRLTRLATIVALAFGGVAASNVASADVSYNVGWASEYYYRGILQKNSSASAGVDFEQGGFFAGAWMADVGDGAEVDGYFGYGIETEGGLSASIGFTGYYYTGEFDDTYEEINLNLGYGIAGLEYSVGEWDGFDVTSSRCLTPAGCPKGVDYDFLALTLTSESGFYGTYGSFGDGFDGEYLELGWGTTISEIDFGIAVILSSDELSDQCDSTSNLLFADCGDPGTKATESEAIVFTIAKSF